jgi:hypothetical protein
MTAFADEDFWRRRFGPLTLAAWAGVVVLLVAMLLRVSLLESARLTGDEARDWSYTSQIAAGKQFPVLGLHLTDGTAKLPGPAFFYLMALPSVFSRQAEAQFLFVEVLGALGALAFWGAMRRPFGEGPAFAAGLLVAASPWAALYADRTWNPNVMVPFAFLSLLAASKLRDAPSSKWLMVLAPSLAVMLHIHMSAPVFWVAMIPVVLPTVRSWRRRTLLAALGLVLLLYLPYIGYELYTGFANTKQLLAETVGAKKETRALQWPWVPVYLVRLLTLDVTYHENMGYWGGPDEWKNLASLWKGTTARPFHALRFAALVASGLLFLSAMAAGVVALVRDRRVGPWGAAFVAVLAANTALIALSGKQVFGHYVILMLPVAFVAYAHLLATAWPRRAARVVVLVLAGIFVVGGFEAALSTSYRTDGRNGLAVHRGFFRAVHAAMDREGLPPNEPVKLDFGFPGGSLYHYDVFQKTALDRHVRFDGRATKLRYRLVDVGTNLPPAAILEGPVDLGYAWLYRVK